MRVGLPPPLPPEEVARRVRLLAGVVLDAGTAADAADQVAVNDRDFVLQIEGSDVVSGLVRAVRLTVGQLLDA